MSNNLSNKYQYDDLLKRSQDPYANVKYGIVLDWLKKENIRTVLNGGCGSGELSILLAQRGYNVTGFDPDRDYIELANKNSQKAHLKNCKFEVSSIESYKSKMKYDAVIATDVLEHIKDDRYAFEKLTAFVKPKGVVIITVPAGQYLFGFHDEQLGHFRRYSISGFSKLIPKNLDTKYIRYFGFFLIPVAFWMSKHARKTYPNSNEIKNPIIGKVLDLIFVIEKYFKFPFGTSLLFLAVKLPEK